MFFLGLQKKYDETCSNLENECQTGLVCQISEANPDTKICTWADILLFYVK